MSVTWDRNDRTVRQLEARLPPDRQMPGYEGSKQLPENGRNPIVF
jgi:hypothetical protein